jgi:hypothetical protein
MFLFSKSWQCWSCTEAGNLFKSAARKNSIDESNWQFDTTPIRTSNEYYTTTVGVALTCGFAHTLALADHIFQFQLSHPKDL